MSKHDILRSIVRHKKAVLRELKKKVSLGELQHHCKLLVAIDPSCRMRFQKTIGAQGIHLVAEIKKASPSAGIIRKDFDPVGIAKNYEAAGAGCLSVVTEDKFFQGRWDYLSAVRKEVKLPLLCKDFIVDVYQLYEAKVRRADAVLLIAFLLPQKKLKQFLDVCRTLRLDAVVEVHTRSELAKALKADARIIGINARDLKDFSVDLSLVSRLFPLIPRDRLVICESGIRNIEDLLFVKRLGVNAVLVGEALMRARDVFAKTKEFVDFLKTA